MLHDTADRTSTSVLVIDSDGVERERLAAWLAAEGMRVRTAPTAEQGFQIVSAFGPDVILCDVRCGEESGLDLLARISALHTDTAVIMTATSPDTPTVVTALRLGAVDFQFKPFTDPAMLVHSVRRAAIDQRLQAENRAYRAELEARNRELQESLRVLKEDQEAGRAVQLKILPSTHKTYGPVDIEFRIQPSLYLSGDFVDHFRVSETQVGFYLADVSGHGASSAFLTIMLKTMANRLRRRYRDVNRRVLQPAEIVSRANDEVFSMALGKHLTLFCGLIDLAERTLTYCSASHFPPPQLFTRGEVVSLEGQGLPVGLFEKPGYENVTVPLGEEFVLWACSDGVIELLGQLPLKAKEALLVEKMGQAAHNVGAFLASLGISSESSVPDDIAVVRVSGSCQ